MRPLSFLVCFLMLASPALAVSLSQVIRDCGDDGKFTYSVEPSVENDTALLKIK